MVGKKGFLRIVEASIGIMAILGTLLLVSLQSDIPDIDLTEKIPAILDEIAKNSTLREDIALNYNFNREADNSQINLKIENFFKKRISTPNVEYDFAICKAEELCALENFPLEYNEEVYSYERVVSAVETKPEFEPRKIKLYVWRKA